MNLSVNEPTRAMARLFSRPASLRGLFGTSDIGGRIVSTILIGLFVICLFRPTNLDIQVGNWLFWLGLLIMPGYLLAEILTWQVDLDWIERLALAFPLGIAAMAPVGETVILAHFDV